MHKGALAGVAVLAMFGCRTADDTDVVEIVVDEAAVSDAKAALEKYADVGVAATDGFVSLAEYVYHPELGAMGVHFLNPGRLGLSRDQVLAAEPQILLYNLDEDGQYMLGGAEWYTEDQETDEPPMMFGVPFDGPMEGHTPEMGVHYDLHGWFWIENPNGINNWFAEFNPGMTPPSWVDEYNTVLGARHAEGANDGYTEMGACEEGLGTRYTNPDVTAVADPAQPNAIFMHDFGTGAMVVGVEWTAAASDGATLMGGKDFVAEGDQMVFRMWSITSPLGVFATSNPAIVCP